MVPGAPFSIFALQEDHPIVIDPHTDTGRGGEGQPEGQTAAEGPGEGEGTLGAGYAVGIDGGPGAGLGERHPAPRPLADGHGHGAVLVPDPGPQGLGAAGAHRFGDEAAAGGLFGGEAQPEPQLIAAAAHPDVHAAVGGGQFKAVGRSHFYRHGKGKTSHGLLASLGDGLLCQKLRPLIDGELAGPAHVGLGLGEGPVAGGGPAQGGAVIGHHMVFHAAAEAGAHLLLAHRVQQQGVVGPVPVGPG